MPLPRGLLKRVIREGYSPTDAMGEAWRRVRKNPGTKWHGREATRAEGERYGAEGRGSFIGAHYYRGKRDAHRESQEESRRMGLNPGMAVRYVSSRGIFEIKTSTGKVVKLSSRSTATAMRKASVLMGKALTYPNTWIELAGKNPGAAWHEGQERMAEAMEKRETRPRRRTYLKGMADAHALSAHESRKMGLNPRREDIPYKVGERVKYRREFLRSIAWHTNVPRAGTVVALTKMGKELWPTIQWDEFFPEPIMVNPANIMPAKRPDVNPRGAKTVVGRVFRAQRWAKRWARGRPVRKVKGGWQVQAGRKRTPAQELAHRRKVRPRNPAYREPGKIKRPWKVKGAIYPLEGPHAGKWYVPAGKVRRKNPIAVYNPPPGRMIYGQVLAVQARKTNGTYRGKSFQHKFSPASRVAMYALPDGSVLLKSGAGKRLWQDR